MIRSLLTLTAAATICLLLTACSEGTDPANANKPDRPPPATPQQAPDAGVGDQAQQGAPPPSGGNRAPSGGGN